MSVDTVARFVITLAADPEKLALYRKSSEDRVAMVNGLDAASWPLTAPEKQFLFLGDFNQLFTFLDENGGGRGINEIQT
jgi:hypothetical protein